MMDLNLLLSSFPLCTFSATSLICPGVDITAPSLLEPGQNDWCAEYLYVGRAADLPKNRATADVRLNLILDKMPESDWINACNFAILQNSDALFSVFNALHHQFVRQQQTTTQINRLFSALLTHEGIQNLIEQASVIFGNPLLFMESDGRFLSWRNELPEGAAEEIFTDRLRGELGQGAMDDAHIRQLRESAVISRMSKERDVQLYFDNYLNCTSMIAPVIVGSIEIAWLHMVEFSKPFEDFDAAGLSFFAKQLSQEMQKNDSFKSISLNDTDYFLQWLLETPHPNELAVHRQLDALHIKPMDKYYLAILHTNASSFSHMGYSALKQQLYDTLIDSLWGVYQGDFIILLGMGAEAEIPSHTKSLLRRTAITNHMIVGISNAFSSLGDAQQGYQQAQTAIRLGGKYPITYNTGRPICQYYQYSFLDMLEKCCKDSDILQYCSPMLLRLLSYDQKDGTDLMNTLFEYLENSRNLMQTASVLYIHKNTLLNRLNRIRTIMQCDLSNNWDVFLLSLSFRILAHQNIYRANSVNEIWEMWERISDSD